MRIAPYSACMGLLQIIVRPLSKPGGSLALMDGMPLVIDLEGRHCLCVGGGNVVARRIPSLRAAGANLTIVAPRLHPDLRGAVDAGDIVHVARAYQSGDIRGSFLILAATDVPAVDRAVAAEALATDRLVCVASEPRLGNCQFLAGVRRGRLLVALYSGGAAPAVTGALRRRIEHLLPEDLGRALDAVAAARSELRRQVDDASERARRWDAVIEAGAIEMLLDGDVDTGIELTRRTLLSEGHDSSTRATRSDL